MTGQRGRWDTTQACERFGQLHTEPVCPASPSEPACLDVGRLRQGKQRAGDPEAGCWARVEWVKGEAAGSSLKEEHLCPGRGSAVRW